MIAHISMNGIGGMQYSCKYVTANMLSTQTNNRLSAKWITLYFS